MVRVLEAFKDEITSLPRGEGPEVTAEVLLRAGMVMQASHALAAASDKFFDAVFASLSSEERAAIRRQLLEEIDEMLERNFALAAMAPGATVPG